MPYITTGGGGMGNQIKKFISAIRLDPNSKSHLPYFQDIFKNRSVCVVEPGVKYTPINTWRIIVLDSDTEIPNNFCQATTKNKDFDNCDTLGRNIDFEYLRIPMPFRLKIIKLVHQKLVPSLSIQNQVNSFIKHHGNYSSVHIRSFNADNFINDKSSRHASKRNKIWINEGRQKCINYINNLSDKKIFLSSDSQSESTLIKQSCPNKIFINYIDKDSNRSFESDFTDMILLSKGNHMILNPTSTFSELAWYFGGCNENIHIC